MQRGQRIRPTAPPGVRAALRRWWSDEPLTEVLATALRERPGEPALVDGEVRLDYAALGRAVGRLAALLQRLGIGEGDVVLAELPNWWEAHALAHAAWRLGAVFNPVVPIYRERELRFILAEARPALAVVPHRFRGVDYAALFDGLRADDGFPPAVLVARSEGPLPAGFHALDELLAGPALHEPPAVAADAVEDVALLLYTSGTTGSPKGVLHTHATLLYEVDSIIDLARLTAADHIFMPSPLTHITGLLYGSLMPVRLGCGCTYLDRWDAEAARVLVERERATVTVAATPFLQGLLDAYARAGTPSSLEVFICGGADVPPELVRSAWARLGTRVVRAYGLSEMPTYCCGDPYGSADAAAGSDGRPVGPSEGRLVAEPGEPAELQIRGPELFAGYLDASANAAAFTPDGWFRTGDAAAVAPDGAVTILGRLKDIIVRGGENISAKEVEDVLAEHPGIAEVAVVASPDPLLGERPYAFVVPRAGVELALADLQAHLGRCGLAKPKWPEGLACVPELPKTPSGKVRKVELRALLREQGA